MSVTVGFILSFQKHPHPKFTAGYNPVVRGGVRLSVNQPSSDLHDSLESWINFLPFLAYF
jgi:hypothetical protein